MLGNIAAGRGAKCHFDVGGHTRRPLFVTSALGMVLLAGGVVLLAGLVAFFVALTTSGSFALWAIELLLDLAGA